MHRILLIIGLLPILAALIARQAARGRMRRGAGGRGNRLVLAGALTAEDLAREVLRVGGAEAEVVAEGNGWFPAMRGPLKIPADCAGATDAVSLGIAVQEAGLRLLAGRSRQSVESRMQVLRFGAGAPAMSMLIAIFAVFAMRGAIGWILAGVVLVSGFACLVQLLGITVELHAATLGAAALRKSGRIHRVSDFEAIESAARAAAWRRALPASLAWILP
jgi:hypothetical protein